MIKVLLKVSIKSLLPILIQEGKRVSKSAVLHLSMSLQRPDSLCYPLAIQSLFALQVCTISFMLSQEEVQLPSGFLMPSSQCIYSNI